MHKFNLEITLQDKNNCNTCPLCGELRCELFGLRHNYSTKVKGAITRPDICKQNDKPTNWDDLSYNQKEKLRKRNPELWKKLYRQKFGLGN